MPTPTHAMRLPQELTDAARRKGRSLGLRTLTDCVTAALAEWAGEAAPPSAVAAEARAAAAEAELGRAITELALLRHQAAGDARTGAEERFVTLLESATGERPVSTARLIAVSGWGRWWVSTVLLPSLVREGYVTRPRKGWYACVPGADLREGMRAARAQGQRAGARIAPGKREAGNGAPPVTGPAVPSAEATQPAKGSSAAMEGGAPKPRRTRASAGKRAPAGTPPPVAANGQHSVITGLREQMNAIAPGTVLFQEPGSERIVTSEVPGAADKICEQPG